MPRLTVLMAVHNGAKYLRQAIRSVIWQDISDMAIVIVDDASTDESYMIALDRQRLYGRDIRVYQLPYHLGQTAALRYGLAQCDSEYVARQDADDLSFPSRLATQVAYLDANPRIVALASRVRILDEAGNGVHHGRRLRWMPKVQMRVGRNPFVHGATTFRRDVAEKVGGYLPCFEYAQDLSLWLRMAKWGRLKVLPDVLYGLRAHGDRVTVTRRGQQLAFAELARFAGGGCREASSSTNCVANF